MTYCKAAGTVRDVSASGGGDDNDEYDDYRVSRREDTLFWQNYTYVGGFYALKMEPRSLYETHKVVPVKTR